jgi:hypothetical protein
MIPTRKKTPEELAALRGEIDFSQEPKTEPEPPAEQPKPPMFQKVIGRVPKWTPPPAQTSPAKPEPKKRTIHTLRKVELPLGPAPEVYNKTPLPQRRHSQSHISEIRRREALANVSDNLADPVSRLKKLTAHPILLTPTYLIGFTAIYTAWNRVYFITPITLIFVSGLLTAYIFWKKKRSRHHAAILMIILIMTLVFGGIHYAPFFSAYAT